MKQARDVLMVNEYCSSYRVWKRSAIELFFGAPARGIESSRRNRHGGSFLRNRKFHWKMKVTLAEYKVLYFCVSDVRSRKRSQTHATRTMMMTLLRSAAAALVLLSTSSTHAFVKPTTVQHVSQLSTTSTQLNMFDFLKKGKQALVKSLAGDYDEAAVRARLDGLINNNPVLMLSFTT